MSNRYFVLIDKRDSEKFRNFKNQKFNNETINILKKYNSNFIWAFHKVQIKDNLWKKIKKNDQIYLSIPETNFEIVAYVSKVIFDTKIGKRMWPDNLNSEHLTYFLLFEKLEKVMIPFNTLLDHSIKPITVHLPGIYEIEKKFKSSKQKEKPISKRQFVAKPFSSSISTDPTQKNYSEVMRFVRDTSKVKKLKKLYNNRCQICSYTFEYDANKFYSEVHHYHPLKELADDDLDNMIVVCPNHHAEFDYNLIAIDLDGHSIVNGKGEIVGEIHFHKEHKLNKKNIQSQLNKR